MNEPTRIASFCVYDPENGGKSTHGVLRISDSIGNSNNINK